MCVSLRGTGACTLVYSAETYRYCTSRVLCVSTGRGGRLARLLSPPESKVASRGGRVENTEVSASCLRQAVSGQKYPTYLQVGSMLIVKRKA